MFEFELKYTLRSSGLTMHLMESLWSPFDPAAREASRNFHRVALRSVPCKTEVKDRCVRIRSMRE